MRLDTENTLVTMCVTANANTSHKLTFTPYSERKGLKTFTTAESSKRSALVHEKKIKSCRFLLKDIDLNLVKNAGGVFKREAGWCIAAPGGWCQVVLGDELTEV